MHGHRFAPQVRVGIQLLFQKCRTANDDVQFTVNFFPLPKRRFCTSDDRTRPRAVNAPMLDAVYIMSTQTLFARVSFYPLITQMIRADQLMVVGGVEDAAGLSALPPPLVRLKEDAGRQLIVEIVEMDNIWSKIIQHQPQLLPGLGGINSLERICKLRQPASAVEIHAAGVGPHPVAHTAALVLHPEILHLVAHLFQLLP